jgi:hypothetical protein
MNFFIGIWLLLEKSVSQNTNFLTPEKGGSNGLLKPNKLLSLNLNTWNSKAIPII